MQRDIVRITGSHGAIVVDAISGEPVAFEDDTERDEWRYSGLGIVKFDLEEYREAYPNRRDHVEIDFVDVGYWWTGGYEAPDAFHREMMRSGMGAFTFSSQAAQELFGSDVDHTEEND